MSFNVASSSTVIPLTDFPTVNEMKGFTAVQLNRFLKERLNNIDYYIDTITMSQVIDGSTFFDFTVTDFERWGIPGGPSKRIEKLIKDIQGEPPTKRAKIEDIGERSLKNFWHALKITDYDELSLFLVVSQNFLGKPSQPSRLFVRKCYNDLLNIILNDNIRNLCLFGNPGIGKTFFGYFLLYFLARKNKTIIYDIHTMIDQVILFDQEDAYYERVQDSIEIRKYLSNPEVWYIVDGKQPNDSEAKTILICSPLKHYYSVFDKRIPDVRYMPPWSWEEINTCRNNIFTNLPEKKVQELYLKWGGIPRYVLDGALMRGTQDQFASAITTCDESIFKYIGRNTVKDDISHKLIHIWTNLPEESNDNINPQAQSSTDQLPKPLSDQPQIQVKEKQPYTKMIVKCASDYVGQQLILNLKKDIMEKFCRNMDIVLDGGKSNQVLGCIFEQIAHQALRNGGTFKRRSLDTNDEDSVVFSRRDLILFTQIDEIQNGAYSIPLDKSFPSLDAIVAPSCLLQMTTAMNHTIKVNGLKRVQSKLETGKDIDFYFVVPAQLYNVYRRQRYSTTDNSDAVNMGPWIGQRLKQYVLEIDLSIAFPAEMSSTLSRGETSTLPNQVALESKCNCKGPCKNNNCGCKRSNLPCGDGCHPKNMKCKNIPVGL